MRIAVLGAGGMLGRDLVPALTPRHEVIPLGRAEADVTDAEALRERFRETRPEAVINCAAATHVDRCETEPEWAYRVNAAGARLAAEAAAEVGARFVHVSTDFVFSGGMDRPYVETDPVGPISVYGASKLLGEVEARGACAETLVVRTQWLYGRGGRSFPRIMLDAARKNPGGLRVVSDQWGAPTYTVHLAWKLAWMVEHAPAGLYHVNNDGECSRYEWAVETLALGGLDGVPVQAIRTEEWPTPARRPARSTLRRGALEALDADDLLDWREGLAAFIRELRTAGEL